MTLKEFFESKQLLAVHLKTKEQLVKNSKNNACILSLFML